MIEEHTPVASGPPRADGHAVVVTLVRAVRDVNVGDDEGVPSGIRFSPDANGSKSAPSSGGRAGRGEGGAGLRPPQLDRMNETEVGLRQVDAELVPIADDVCARRGGRGQENGRRDGDPCEGAHGSPLSCWPVGARPRLIAVCNLRDAASRCRNPGRLSLESRRLARHSLQSRTMSRWVAISGDARWA